MLLCWCGVALLCCGVVVCLTCCCSAALVLLLCRLDVLLLCGFVAARCCR